MLFTLSCMLPVPAKSCWTSLCSTTFSFAKENKYTLLVAGVATVTVGVLLFNNGRLRCELDKQNVKNVSGQEASKDISQQVESLKVELKQLKTGNEKLRETVKQQFNTAIGDWKANKEQMQKRIRGLEGEVDRLKLDNYQLKQKVAKLRSAASQQKIDYASKKKQMEDHYAGERKKIEEAYSNLGKKEKDFYNTWYSTTNKKDKELAAREKVIKEEEKRVEEEKNLFEKEKNKFELRKKSWISEFF